MNKAKLYTQYFLFQKNDILFSLQLSDILSCVSFLEKIGFLPPLPEDYFEKAEKYEQEDNWRMALLLYDNGTDVLDTKTWNVPEEMPDPGKVLADVKYRSEKIPGENKKILEKCRIFKLNAKQLKLAWHKGFCSYREPVLFFRVAPTPSFPVANFASLRKMGRSKYCLL